MKNLKLLRTEKKLSQENLSKKIGVSRSTVAMWENGSSQPDTDTLIKLSEIFNVSVDYLIGNSEFKSKEEMLNHFDETNDIETLKDGVDRYEEFTNKDKKDIAKIMDFTLDALSNEEALMFDGEPLDEETLELLKVSLENSIKMGKMMAKKKFTPNKYKK